MRDACLLLFTKPARPGRVKTRLIGDPGEGAGALTPEQAAELHQAFLDDVIRTLAPGRFDLTLAWAIEDGVEPPRSELAAVRQTGEDLGERLFEALSRAGRKYRLVGAVGSDHPELLLGEIERGFSLLRSGVDLVLGPAIDGGYYFLGARTESLQRDLFAGIEWSTPEVLERTLERGRELALSVMLLREGRDIDTPEDLEHLSRRLARATDSAEVVCPSTAALLREWRPA